MGGALCDKTNVKETETGKNKQALLQAKLKMMQEEFKENSNCSGTSQKSFLEKRALDKATKTKKPFRCVTVSNRVEVLSANDSNLELPTTPDTAQVTTAFLESLDLTRASAEAKDEVPHGPLFEEELETYWNDFHQSPVQEPSVVQAVHGQDCTIHNEVRLTAVADSASNEHLPVPEDTPLDDISLECGASTALEATDSNVSSNQNASEKLREPLDGFSSESLPDSDLARVNPASDCGAGENLETPEDVALRASMLNDIACQPDDMGGDDAEQYAIVPSPEPKGPSSVPAFTIPTSFSTPKGGTERHTSYDFFTFTPMPAPSESPLLAAENEPSTIHLSQSVLARGAPAWNSGQSTGSGMCRFQAMQKARSKASKKQARVAATDAKPSEKQKGAKATKEQEKQLRLECLLRFARRREMQARRSSVTHQEELWQRRKKSVCGTGVSIRKDFRSSRKSGMASGNEKSPPVLTLVGDALSKLSQAEVVGSPTIKDLIDAVVAHVEETPSQSTGDDIPVDVIAKALTATKLPPQSGWGLEGKTFKADSLAPVLAGPLAPSDSPPGSPMLQGPTNQEDWYPLLESAQGKPYEDRKDIFFALMAAHAARLSAALFSPQEECPACPFMDD
ncbi:hypothetical protein CYMTET_3591 [Cymbomonas tetramitiformis]|uniref:Uncharacterized protein n=1 Tax=Cymbomonas tetramitiformis TaxID=36881 RepID=A0AAE0LL75_9CHLO|nr:hypothetical protein CYMTET_3591 [Cymbomonas tetramitiformis]